MNEKRWPVRANNTIRLYRTCSDEINGAFIPSPFKINDEKESRMKPGKVLATTWAVVTMASGVAMATPATQIWIPSPDVKGFKDVHVDIDYYGRFSNNDNAGANMYDIGLGLGVSPFENVKLEIGADFLKTTTGNSYDSHPFYFNAKMGIPEDAFGVKGMPAVAVGIYNIGTYKDSDTNTMQNISYGLVAKTLPVVGRFSAGGYYGSESALGKNANTGVLASWDRTMSEISDKLWLAVDYMSGNNYNGALSMGGSWAFTKNVSLLVGAVFFNPFQEDKPGGKPTFTTQLDLSF
jgi:hypothetical protein